MALASTACTAKSLRVGDAEVKNSALIFARVLKVDADPVDAGRHREGDFEVGLVLLAFHLAGEHQVCGRVFAYLLSNRPGCERKSQKNEVHTPSFHGCLEAEAKNIRAGRHDHILPAGHHKRHG